MSAEVYCGFKQCGGPLAEFDEALWCASVEAVTVNAEKFVAIIFRDGSIIRVD
jgi:hypothetical protein